MELNHDICYEAIKVKDPRFDGRFFTAVKSTGIYCRSVCKVPAPKSDNCIFYHSVAEAESKGYRPCLRCRPELAPDYSEFEQGEVLLKLLIQYFDEKNYRPKLIEESAEHFGVSARHISRIFHDGLGVSPMDYIMTKRLLNAKKLLTDTKLPIGEIAYMVGFGSSSRFNAALKKRYRLTPSDIRKQKKTTTSDSVIIKLFYRPPYNWEQVIGFFKMRAIPGVESIGSKGEYRRSLRIIDNGNVYSGWIELTPLPDESLLQAKISNSLSKVLLQVIRKIRLAFDLDASPELLPKDLPKGLRIPGCFDSFEMSCRSILGQQITVKAATTLSGRIAEKLGGKVETPWKEVRRHFPTIRDICDKEIDLEDRLGEIGIIRSRTQTILSIAKEMLEGNLVLNPGENPDELREKLIKIKGIGEWTAEYLTMRGLSWPDAFLVTDLVIKNKLLEKLEDNDGYKLIDNHQNLSKYKLNKLYEIKALEAAEQYRPWRSYYNLAIWNDLI